MANDYINLYALQYHDKETDSWTTDYGVGLCADINRVLGYYTQRVNDRKQGLQIQLDDRPVRIIEVAWPFNVYCSEDLDTVYKKPSRIKREAYLLTLTLPNEVFHFDVDGDWERLLEKAVKLKPLTPAEVDILLKTGEEFDVRWYSRDLHFLPKVTAASSQCRQYLSYAKWRKYPQVTIEQTLLSKGWSQYAEEYK